jgi:hypothetical protein
LSEQPRVPAGSPEGGEWVSEKGHRALLSSSTPLTQGQEYAVSKWRDTSAYRRIGERLRFGDEENVTWKQDGSPSLLEEDIRREDAEMVTTVIKGLDSAIAAQKPLAQDIVVHRGLDLGRLDEAFYDMDSDEAVDDFLRTYSDLEDASFVATSVSARVAAKFTGSSKHAVVLKIRVPKGAKVLPIESSKNFGSAGEEEVLLPRGTHIRLLHQAGFERGLRSPHLDRARVIEAEVVQ